MKIHTIGLNCELNEIDEEHIIVPKKDITRLQNRLDQEKEENERLRDKISDIRSRQGAVE